MPDGINLGEAPLTLAALAKSQRWVAWQSQDRPGADKPTKTPVNPMAGANAKSDQASTWSNRANAESRAAKLPKPYGLGGVALILGIHDGVAIGGLDLDTCRNPQTGELAGWTRTFLDTLHTYAEVSPSGTGIKLFFRYDPDALPELQKLMGTKTGRKWAAAGGDHPPGIELYLTGRFFAVTDQAIDANMVAVFLFAVQWDVTVGRRLQALFVTLSWRGIGELWRAVLVGKPDVLIVDNVDRAVVEQQRAFFYALRRHRDLLPSVVIVAFDETALSMADPNPDAPQELLAKVFSTCVRLYPMTRDDAVNLVEHILKEMGGCGGNDARWPLRFLRQYAAAGDLARIFLLHRRHSVRYCKQFVNTLGVSAVMLRIDDSADFSALMRLLGLFEFLPWLRHDPKALEDMLNDEDVDALLRFAASLVGREKLVADLDAGVRNYMRLTRHMLPAFADWSEFVARFGSPQKSDLSAATTPPKAASAGPALLCLPERSKGEEMAEPDRAWLRCWLELDTLHAEETDAARRRDALRRKSKEVLAKTWPSNPPPASAQQQLGWIYLIQRLWLADGGLAGELQNEDWLPGQYFLAETGHWWDEYARNTEPDSCFASMLQDGGLRDAFIRLNLASPPGPLSLMRGCLTIAFMTNRRAGQTRAIPRFLRRMVSITEDNNWPLVIPALLSHRFDLDNDIAFLSEKLPGLPRGRDLDTPEGWAMAKRLVEFRGRMHRGGFEGALAPVRDWVRHVRMLRGSDPTAMGHLLQVAVSGLPRFGGSLDGAWLESAALDCADVLAGRHEVSEVKALEHALRSVADVDVPNLILFAVSQGNADAAAILARQCSPPTSWPVSYLRCMDALVCSPADPRRSVLDASAAQVLLSGALSRHRTSMRRFLTGDQGLMTTSLLSLIRPNNA